MTHAILLAALADGLLSLMDAIIKILTARYATFQIAFLRFASGLVWASVLLAVVRPGWPSRETVLYNSTRSVLVVITATSFFYALSQLPLADAVALSFLSPLFIALFGALFLKERIDARIGLALVAGFAGMMLIAGARVGSGTYSTGAIYGTAACVLSAVAYGLALVLLRARALRDALSIIVWFQNLGPAVLLAPAAAFVWTTPTLYDLGLFILIGMIGVAGHFLLASAFARAEAARLAPVHYTTLIWGVVFGYLFFSDLPGTLTLAGAALIIVATVATHRSKAPQSPSVKAACEKKPP
jgi:drug/metabolite transporter (DMT)-like permease